MKKVFLLSIFVLSFTIARADGSSWWNTDYNTTEGTEFWVTFMRNSGSGGQDNKDMSLYVYATARQNATIKITNPYSSDTPITFNVTAGKQDSCLIPNSWAYLETPKKVNNFGIKVTATSPISLYATNQHSSGKYDATNILPTKALTGEYIVQTYHIDQYSTEFAIVATQSQTIKLQIRKTTIDIDKYNNNILDVISTETEDLELQMKAGQTYLYRSATDDNGGNASRATSLSGTSICSSKPLALFVGGQSAKIPFVDPENHIFSQIYPIDKWGRTFIVTPTYGMVYDYVQITAFKNNTRVYKDGEYIATLNAFETLQDTIKSEVLYNSTNDAFLGIPPSFNPQSSIYYTTEISECYLYATGYGANHPSVVGVGESTTVTTQYGAPVLTPIVPQELSMSSSIFATFTKSSAKLKHYVNIVTPTSEINTMYLDGTNISSDFKPVNSNNEYSFAIKEVSAKSHLIENRGHKVNSTFTARVYGLGSSSSSRESYAYSAGSRTNRSTDLLINDEYVKSIDVCINEDPIKFSAIVNFDYDNITWLSQLTGTQSKSGTKDSILHIDYHKAGTDSLLLIVKSHTDLCETIYHYDTIRALVTVHDTAHIDERYGDTTFQTICYGEHFSIAYKDQDGIHRPHNYIADTVTTQNFQGGNIKFQLNTEYLALDSFKTAWGCDSVIWRRFIIRPTCDTTIYDTICVNHLPYRWADKNGDIIHYLSLSQGDSIALVRNTVDKASPKLINDSKTFQTIYGCDSVVRINLIVLPIYDIKDPDEKVCIDSLHYYQWEGHTTQSGILPGHKIYLNGERITDGLSLKTPGTYTYTDSLKTIGCQMCNDRPGCDSIFTITITVLEQVVNRADTTLCDNQAFEWKDSLYIGSNFKEDSIPEIYKLSKKYRRIGNTTLYHTFQTADEYHCDALDILYVSWCKTYNTKEVFHICEDETYQYRPRAPMSHPHDKDYKWTCEDKQIKQITLCDTVETITKCSGDKGCDSVVTHIIYVHPVYHYSLDTVVCQVHDGTFTWEEHDLTKGIWDNKKHKRVNTIPIDKAGEYRFVDSLKTITCTDCRNTVGCDSIWTLTLKVNPVYDTIESRSLCDNDTLHWYGKVYVGNKASADKAGSIAKRYAAKDEAYRDIAHFWNGNKYTDSVHLHTINGCDSIYWLELKVNPTYNQTLDEVKLCQGETEYVWRRENKDEVIETIPLPTEGGNEEDDFIYRTTITRTITTLNTGCDSTLNLPIIVYKTYNMPAVEATACESEKFYTWKITDIEGKLQDMRIDFPDKLNKKVWETTKTKTLKSSHDCDSIINLHLTVYPTLDTVFSIVICPEQLPSFTYPDGTTPKITTGQETYTFTTKSKQYDCDSIVTINFSIRDKIEVKISKSICDNDEPYTHDYSGVAEGVGTRNFINLHTTGIYRDTLTSSAGCDSIVILDFKVNPTYNRTLDEVKLCQGETEYVWKRENKNEIIETIPLPTEGGNEEDDFIYRDTITHTIMTLHTGCDSTLNLPVVVYRKYNIQVYDTICEQEKQYIWDLKDINGTHDKTITIPDNLSQQPKTITQTETLRSRHDCDSVIHLNLYVKPTLYKTVDLQLCPEQLPYTFCAEAEGNAGIAPLEYKGGIENINLTSKQYKCDSIVTYNIQVSEVDIHEVNVTICNNELPYSYNYPTEGIESQPIDKQRLLNLYRDTLAYDTMRHEGQCMHIVALHLTINDTTTYTDRHYYCKGETYIDSDFPEITATKDTTYIKRLTKRNSVGCDSVVAVVVKFGETYTGENMSHDKDTTLCESEGSFTWRTKDTHSATDYTHELKWGDLKGHVLDTTLYDTLHTNIPFHCDSITSIHVMVNPTIISEETVTWCKSAGEYEYGEKGKTAFETGFYIDTLKTPNRYGCDSILWLHLTVLDSIYYKEQRTMCDNDTLSWQHVLYVGDNYHGSYDTNEYDSIKVVDAKIHYDTVTYKTVNDCDSAYYLRLTVHPTSLQVSSSDTTRIDICDIDIYHFTTANQDSAYNQHGEWQREDKKITSYIITGMDTTVWGCDSAVAHVITVYPTYNYADHLQSCQGRRFIWEGHEGHTLWDTQKNTTISADDILTDVRTGDYVYIDYLQTIGKHQCDSIWTLTLHIDSTYYHADTITMSDEESRKWEHTVYIGSKVERDTLNLSSWFDSNEQIQIVQIPDKSIINEFDTVYPSVNRCDSTLHLRLLVGPTYRDTIVRYTCDNEPYHWYHNGDDKEARTDITLLEPKLYYDSLKTVGFGFDSIYVLDLRNNPTYSFAEADTACQAESNYIWEGHEGSQYYYLVEENRRVLSNEIKLAKAGTFTYIDSLKTTAYKKGDEQILEVGCDSVWTLQLLVPPSYSFNETLTICENDTVRWQNILFIGSQFLTYGKEYDAAQYDSVRTNMSAGIYHSRVEYKTEKFECDSIYNVEIIVNPIPHLTIYDRACQREEFYYPNLNNGVGCNLNTTHVGEYTFVDTIQTHAGCDSIITLIFNVDSVYNYSQKDSVCQVYGGVWTWYNEYGDKQADISIDKGDTTIIVGTTYKTIHGCDSVFGMQLYVKPIYHFYEELTICESDSIGWQGVLYSGNQFLAYNTNGFDASLYKSSVDNLAAGIYNYTANYKTHLDCDSIYHLKLTVKSVPHVTIYDRACQREEFYYPNLNNGVGGNLNTAHVGEYTFVDTIQTHAGCDSIITLIFNVDSVYDYRQYEEVCQDTINYQYEWVDNNTGASHGFIDISEAGDFAFEDKNKTIHGCDSIYGITLHVKPIYRFDSLYTICENERISWQNRWYAGDSAQIIENDRVLAVGLHYDTARYTTIEGCDSIYYLQLRVNAIYDTTQTATICYTDDYLWKQHDKYGDYKTEIWRGKLQDTTRLTTFEASQPQEAKMPTQMLFQNMLRTIDDCDSLCRLVATVYPTYYFVTDTTICANEKILYRGKYFSSHDTIYTERLNTYAGCDSIYQLRLHIKPTYLFNRTRIICDNEATYHSDGIEVLWQPGMDLPEQGEFLDIMYLTEEGCDSVYRYFITVNPTYYYSQNITLCSNEQTLIQGEHYVGADTLYDTNQFILPFDTIFTDSLQTIHGCDSVYQIFAHILPQYCHIDYDTICDNETFEWQHRILSGSAGTYRYDTTFTNIYGCDSIYIEYLTINPTYDITETSTICDDEIYEWEHRVFVGEKVKDDIQGMRLVAGSYHFDTLYHSMFGCDSIRELNITILPTSEEERWDTICVGEKYVLPNKTLTEAGYYIDTTTNEYGCHHYIYLHLEVIEPTKVTATIDTLCADQYPFMTLYYSYEGHAPVTVSVKFDEQGHEQGFEDIAFQPVSELKDYSGYIDIPIPQGSALPRPGKMYFDPLDERSISYGEMRGFLDADHYEYVRPGHIL